MYCGYITRLTNLRKHSNADRLLIGECFGNSVIVSLEYTEGQLGVYFPVDGQLSAEFCAVNDLVRRKDENGNACGGYLDPDKRNIKAMKLRGEKSDGLFMPLTSLASFTTISDLKEGDTITMLNGVEICRKYIPRKSSYERSYKGATKGRKTVVDIAPTFYQHIDTAQLAYNLDKFHAGDVVELTLKMHGTSARTGNVLIERPRNWLDKLLRRDVKEYGYISGTRRTTLSSESAGYYGDNTFRYNAARNFEGKLRKGEIVYYEIVGYVNESTPIMASVKNSKIKDKEFSKLYGAETVFSYGCEPGECDVYVYRMASVNIDGDLVEYSPEQMRQRCLEMNVKCVPRFETFMIPEGVDCGEYVMRKVEQYYDGTDPVGKTHIREGVVARIVNRSSIEVYKVKNFTFKVLSNIAVDDLTEDQINSMSEDLLSEM